MFTKKDVAAQLNEAGRLMEVLGEDPARARAFQIAARAFEGYEGDVMALYREGRLRSLRGVGSGTEAELVVMFEEGVLPSLAEVRERVPNEVREMFAVSGLGGKRIGLLWKSGITGIEGIIAAAEDGRLAALPGLGAKSAQKILESARFASAARSRMRLDEAQRLSEAIVAALRAEYPSFPAAVAGEYRRGLETVGGIDVVIGGIERDALVDLAERLLDVVEAREGDTVSGKLLTRRVSLTSVPANGFGAALALRTGNGEYRDALVEHARAKGIDLLDPTVWERLRAPDEAAFFALLELPPVQPELRETASPAPVPGLLELADIRGLVHNHSTWSDGALSLREMAAKAEELGFAYLAMADHSQSSAVANGLTPARVAAQAQEVRGVREELAARGSSLELLHGMEVDILPNGELDLPDDLLATLDYAVASVHQNFGLSREAQTQRIVRAVHNPHIHILGHATGRLLLRRPGYDLDLEAVIEACAQTGTTIEINANPRRLDLDWRWVTRAKELGCRFAINPDAHSADGFDDLRFGVTMARKAGLTPAEVTNTAADAESFLRRIRKG